MKNKKTYLQFINKKSSYIVLLFNLSLALLGFFDDGLWGMGWAAPLIWVFFFLLILYAYFMERYIKWERLYGNKK